MSLKIPLHSRTVDITINGQVARTLTIVEIEAGHLGWLKRPRWPEIVGAAVLSAVVTAAILVPLMWHP